MFHFGIFAESGTNIIHIGVQLIFRDVKGRRVNINSLKVYQIGRQLKQCIHISKSHIHMWQRFFSHQMIFYNFLQRCFYQCKRCTYVVGRINKEPCLLIRYLLLFVQHDNTEYDNHNQHQQNCIPHHGPHTSPYRRRNNNLNTPRLISFIFLLIRYGTNL